MEILLDAEEPKRKRWRLGYPFNQTAWNNWDSLTPEQRYAAEQHYETRDNKQSARVQYQ